MRRFGPVKVVVLEMDEFSHSAVHLWFAAFASKKR